MGTIPEFHKQDALALAEWVRKGEVQPLELIDAAIARVERLNPGLNAVVTPIFEQARSIARGPLSEGPFTGVPFLVKDLGAGGTLDGVRMTLGTAFMGQFVPAPTAPVTPPPSMTSGRRDGFSRIARLNSSTG